jgi:hypothetical protein
MGHIRPKTMRMIPIRIRFFCIMNTQPKNKSIIRLRASRII